MPNIAEGQPALVRLPIPVPIKLWDRLEKLAERLKVPLQELGGYVIALQMTGHSLDELEGFVQLATDLGTDVFTQLLSSDQYKSDEYDTDRV